MKTEVNPNKRKNVFELLGYDFLIDEDFRVWLIEVNANPYLGTPNKFIEGLLPEMMDDLLQVVVDPIFHPQIRRESKFDEKINFDIGDQKANKFEMIFSE